jgi:diguanylate cyclase (GGDEF)-like protein
MCVLIVDDSPELALALRVHLCPEFGDVLAARSAAEAFALLGEGPGEPRVQVVLLDVSLPDMDWLEACRRIKQDERTRHLPVLVVTATPALDTLREAFAAGACDFLAKPILPCEVVARVRSALNLKREIDRRRQRERELERLNDELRRLNDELRALAVRDELTGLANRRLFDTLLRREWERAARAGQPLSLILIDVDHFKRYNDRYGHPRGDECLRRVASALAAMARRPGDCVARYGGEEFAVLLPHTGAGGAAAVAEQARQGVRSLALEHGGSPVGPHVTISLGVASAVPGRHAAAGALVAAADLALYEAKERGRDQARTYLPTLDGPPDAPPVPAGRSSAPRTEGDSDDDP